MQIIVGLGNPGEKYQATRHNFGFLVVEALASSQPWNFKKNLNAEICRFTAHDEEVLLVKPQTFMNLSGNTVAQALHFYKEGLASLLVVHDDLDLILGTLRFARSGGFGGHNGVASVIEAVGSQEFCRLRLGIGRPMRTSQVIGYVLENFKEEDMPAVGDMVQKAVEGIHCYLRFGIGKAMNEYNYRAGH